MKILLVSAENTLVCFGHRYVAASLKAGGHEVVSLFSPREFRNLESPAELAAAAGLARATRPDLVAFSVMSSHMPRVRALRDAIRSAVDAPILFGGVHPTLDPEGALAECDLVCVGEGELAARELADALAAGRDPTGIASLWFRRGAEVVRNPVRDRHVPLDDLPWQDHSFEGAFLLERGAVKPLDSAASRRHIPGLMDVLYVLSSRGCPHACTYCCNSALRGVAGGPYVRRRSVADFVAELADLAPRHDWLKGFVFMDDSFMAGEEAWFEEFAAAYRHRVGLPFLCWAAPQAVRPRVVDLLAEAGCVGVHLGLQSGSPEICRGVYNRQISPEEFLAAIRHIHARRRSIRDLRVDVITDNPYETEADTVRTIEVVSRIPKPFFLGLVRLIFYPKTALTERALAEGVIADCTEFVETEFFHYAPTYLNRVLRVTRVTPGAWLRFFARGRASPAVRALFYAYYAYFVLIRLRAKALRRWLLRKLLDRFGDRLPRRWVVIARVQLIDF